MTREEIIIGLEDIHAVACGLDGTQCFINGIGIWQLSELIQGAVGLLKAQEAAVRCKNCIYAPTINAIPPEWLLQKSKQPLTTDGNPFEYVLGEWQDEQEANP